MEDGTALQKQPEEQEEIKFGGMLPGDAMDEDTTEDSAADDSQPEASTSTAAAAAPPPASVPSPAAPARIITLTSTSPDGLRTRTFHAKYYKPVLTDAPLKAAMDLPESYFSPTPSELQTAFAGQVKKREQLVDGPLLTRKLREKEEMEKSRERAGRWPQTRIRIRFNDRSQLEGVFPSTDKLIHIYEFVKLALAPEHQSKPFILYQTPPRQEYIKGDSKYKGKSLIDLQLTPSSVFYIKFSSPSDEALNQLPTPPLLPALLDAAADFPLPPPFDPTASNPPTPPTGEPKSKSQKLGFGGSAGKVTPSWLKIGKTGKK
ncbi:hypothetical protein BCR35DRAFT_281562 [Leucosporidium creatinivorum]|uniref:UBX domain-containing protein n=1 Tax=Leucosporidium creatinivorum TaxID=106004 RepID=A0A1Y2EQ12_9BASI|nr:hypothetical protein BCR35DRAFT_281562 [Leucosporidium creatinivorum]